jgi:hypothetical protein
VKSANRFGSVARIRRSRSSRIEKARSHEIGSNSPAPRSLPGLPEQRPGQPRRRLLLHDPRRSLGADHAAVDRMVRVAVDVAQLAVAQVHADAAAARAHVAGGRLDLVHRVGRG